MLFSFNLHPDQRHGPIPRLDTRRVCGGPHAGTKSKLSCFFPQEEAMNQELVHDVQLDYFGKQLASAGSDRRIKIYDVVDGTQRQQTAELIGHDGPVWQLAWAHPEFGNVLASCSYDRQVFVWKEHSPQHWVLVHKFLGHEGSVNSISWAPRCAPTERASPCACARISSRSVAHSQSDARRQARLRRAVHRCAVLGRARRAGCSHSLPARGSQPTARMHAGSLGYGWRALRLTRMSQCSRTSETAMCARCDRWPRHPSLASHVLLGALSV